MLEDIITSAVIPGVVDDIQKVREILKFVKLYTTAKSSGHCTEHSSDEKKIFLKTVCPQCISFSTTLNVEHDVVTIVDDDSNSSTRSDSSSSGNDDND